MLLEAVTVTDMTVVPTPRLTWWPVVPLSASAGVIATVAPSRLLVAVTVVELTELATDAVYLLERVVKGLVQGDPVETQSTQPGVSVVIVAVGLVVPLGAKADLVEIGVTAIDVERGVRVGRSNLGGVSAGGAGAEVAQHEVAGDAAHPVRGLPPRGDLLPRAVAFGEVFHLGPQVHGV